MGNDQDHQQIQLKLNSLQTIKTHSSYSTLTAKNGVEYIKFIYANHNPQNNQYGNALQQRFSRNNSIFDRKYLQFRYQQQKISNRLTHLPIIFAYGEEVQNSTNSMIKCASTKMSFVVFEHPLKSLKEQIEERITTGQLFDEHEILKLIKATIVGLTQLYNHVKSWNQQVLDRKKFILTEENIFISKKREFIISDIFSAFNLNNFDQIESNLKQEITIKRASRSVSLTNLHSKPNSKRIREHFFENNFSNLASIVEGIIFKFQCFSISQKNSLHQGQSMSTALQSYRGYTRLNTYSNELQNLIKLIKKSPVNESVLLQSVNSIIQNCKVQIKNQKSPENFKMSIRKNSSQNFSIQSSVSHIKSNNFSGRLLQTNKPNKKRQPLQEIIKQNISGSVLNSQNKFSFIKQSNQLLKNNNSFGTHRTARPLIQNSNGQTNQNFNRITQKSSTKIRLSLKKDSQKGILPDENKKSVLKQETKVQLENRSLDKKHSHQKFLCLVNKQNEIPRQIKKEEKSFVLHKVGSLLQNLQIKNSVSAQQRHIENVQHLSRHQKPDENQINDKKNKNIFLKKPCQTSNNVYQCQQQNIINSKKSVDSKDKINQPSNDSQSHMNPISRKKHIGLNKHIPNTNVYAKNIDNGFIFKTADKGLTQMNIQLIQNLSSIISNHNNTMSSYGNPLTDQFKTQNSDIQDEGCVGFHEFFETENKKSSARSSNQYGRKIPSPILQKSTNVKFSTYPSIQLVESILQRPQDKIPQFLKQFKLPQKHLVALNNIILKQKDMIIEQSFEQSDINSFRHSIPNILSVDDDFNELRIRKNSKMILDLINQSIQQQNIQKSQKKKVNKLMNEAINDESSIKKTQQKLSAIYEKTEDSILNQLKEFQYSLINGVYL